MNTKESISTPDDRQAGGSTFADPTQVARRPGLWLAILLRVLGILAIIYFVPE